MQSANLLVMTQPDYMKKSMTKILGSPAAGSLYKISGLWAENAVVVRHINAALNNPNSP
jgi:hypothetical protein